MIKKMQKSEIWWNSLEKDVKDRIIESLYVAYQNSLENDEEINNMKLVLEKEKNKEINELQKQLKNSESLVNSLQKENEEQLKQKLDFFEKENELKIKEKDVEIEKIKNKYQDKLNSVESDIENKYEKDILKLKNEIKNRDMKIQEREFFIEKSQNNQMNEIKEMFGKLERKNKSNYILGAEGENLFDELVLKEYEDVEIINTSKEKNNGDRILKINKVNILIEIKNVSQTTLYSHIQEYRRQIVNDLTISKKSDNINVGILVSIDDTKFVGEQLLNYEFINTENGKMCLIYCANVKEMPFLLYSSIKLAKMISCFLEDIDKDDTELVTILNMSIPIFNNMIKSLKKDHSVLEELQKSNKENRYIIQKFLDNISCLIDLDTKKELDKTELLLKDVFGMCKEIEDSEKKLTYPTLQKKCVEKGMPKHVLRALGGFKKIYSMYNDSKTL